MDSSLIYFGVCWWEAFKTVLLIDLSEVIGWLTPASKLLLQSVCWNISLLAVQGSVNEGFVVT